jgi:hypothetical protein
MVHAFTFPMRVPIRAQLCDKHLGGGRGRRYRAMVGRLAEDATVTGRNIGVSDKEEAEAARREQIKEDARSMINRRGERGIAQALERQGRENRYWAGVRHTVFAGIAFAALALAGASYWHGPAPGTPVPTGATIGAPYETGHRESALDAAVRRESAPDTAVRRESAPEAALSDQLRSRLEEILRDGKHSLSEHAIEIAIGLAWGKLSPKDDKQKTFLDCISEARESVAVALGAELEKTNYTLYKEQFLKTHLDPLINNCIEIFQGKKQT